MYLAIATVVKKNIIICYNFTNVCSEQESTRPADLRLPSDRDSIRLHDILSANNSIFQTITVLQVTRSCCRGLYSLFFPSNSRAKAPILAEIGAVGQTAYSNLKRAAREGVVRLPTSLVIEIGMDIIMICGGCGDGRDVYHGRN